MSETPILPTPSPKATRRTLEDARKDGYRQALRRCATQLYRADRRGSAELLELCLQWFVDGTEIELELAEDGDG